MNITCQACGAERRNVQYKTTRYCESCALLRDLEYLGERTYNCTAAGCSLEFAPVRRGDRWCGECSFSNVIGECVLCQSASVELHRQTIPVCLRCLRSPEQRAFLVKALRRGQRERRTANHHPTEGST